jgi:serine phosphatase RsbU (regulator of sigma subunit)/anti-sigma regulatory factor (Ser/Thr protein kinase)
MTGFTGMFPLLILEALIIIAGVFLIWRLHIANQIYKSKLHLESAFDSIDDPIAIVDRNYTLLRVNKAYVAFLHRSFGDVLRKKCYAVLRGREAPCEDCQLKQVLYTEKEGYVANSPHPVSPERRSISLTFFPFHPKRGMTVSVVEHIRDITELEYLKESLEKRNKSLSDTAIILRRAQAEMKDELALARKIQRSTMPQQAPEIDGMKIDLMYHPIEDVGGDIYDFIPFSDSRCAIFIGDASGHGLPSAFVSTISKMSLYNNTRSEIPPAQLLDRINQDLMGNIRTTHYLTSVYAVFDTEENSITYARAGHPMPIIVRKTGEVFQLGATGTFVGILNTAIYEQRKFYLEEGDRCYLCTDGIYEVFDAIQKAPEVLGFEKFIEIIRSVNHLPFHELIPTIRRKLSAFKYEDDYTLIVVEITGRRTIDISETLPGFEPNEDIAYITFTDYDGMAKQFDAILASMAKKGYTASDIQRIRLCVNELVANAFEHARSDNHNEITLAHSVSDRAVKLCVVDSGPGFDLSLLPDPTIGENIHKEGGRGLYLVKQFVDHIGQNTKGNGVFVVKNK